MRVLTTSATGFVGSRLIPTLLDRLFGPDPPLPVVYLTLLILWDLTYRIGTSWWSAVVALWRAVHVDLSPTEVSRVRRLDVENIGFSGLQLAFVPFLLAVAVVCTAAITSSVRRQSCSPERGDGAQGGVVSVTLQLTASW